MSLDAIRDGLLRTKKNELTACENSRKRKLRELYAVTSDLGSEQWLSLQQPLDASYAAAELRFLTENDIAKGRYFQETTLSIPPPWTKSSVRRSPGAGTRVSKSPAVFSPQPHSPAVQDTITVSAKLPKDLATEETAPRQAEAQELDANQNVDQASSQGPLEAVAPTVQKPVEALPISQSVETPGVDPQSAVPRSSEDVANLPDTIDVQPPSDDIPKPAKTIHLPPKEEQERHLQEIEQAQENARRREKKEDGKLLATISGTTMDDMPSSPSSTAGPFSVNTPMPNQNSPDTSQEEDNPNDVISLRTPISMGPTKQEQNEKDEHDRAVRMQQEIVRQEARGESAITADAQLRQEEQQAVRQTRDGTELMASGFRKDQNDTALTDRASSLVKDVVAADQEDIDVLADDTPAEIQASQPTQDDTGLDMASQAAIKQADNVQDQAITAMDISSKQDSAQNVPSTSRPLAIDTSPIDTPMPDALSSPAFGSNDTTPLKRPPPTPNQTAPERSTTRLSSGAIRHKSVSEILGETPKLASPSIDKTPTAPNFTDQPLSSSPMTATPLTPGVLATLSNNQIRTGIRKDTERSKLSAVVFAKSDNAGVVPVRGEYSQLAGVSKDARRDYYQTMFVSQAYSPPRAQPLSELLSSASKVLTTSNRFAEVHDRLDNRVLRRIYHLQNANKWSLRQVERATEPPHPTTRLDHLLQEMKWMRTDFKEERKWKMTMVRNMANWCAEWVAADRDQRFDLQVKVKTPPRTSEATMHAPSLASGVGSEVDKAQNASLETAGTSEEYDDVEDVQHSSIQPTVAPAAVFSLGLEESIFPLLKTESADKLISELPTFQKPFDLPLEKTSNPVLSLSILPVSKYVHGRVVAMSTAAPRKRSRYEYESEDESVLPDSKHQKLEDDSNASLASRGTPSEQNDVALFYPENKILRDRLHAGHAFRPPSEFPMPPTTFYENRASSQWLWDEDQKLRALVRDYTYNWSLISDALSTSTMYTASPERRTPWECFERWVSLEGLPPEMSKMQYFRTYQTRLEAAQRTVMAHQQAQQQMMAQQGNAAGIQTPLRRRTTIPIRIERRRSARYLGIMDAMRKLARKREALAHKQQEAAKAAALRKHHEAPPPKAGVHTPQEFSNLKHEQEVKLQKRQELYRQQMIATQRQAQIQQRVAQQGNAQQAVPNSAGLQQRSNSNSAGSGTNLAPPPNPHAQQAMNLQRQQMIQQGLQNNMPNGNLGVPNMGIQGMPQAPMQMHMQGHQRMSSHQSPENMRAMLARPNNYQNANSSQYQMQQNNPTQLAAAHMMPANSGIQNQQMLAAAMQNASQNLHVNGSSTNGIVNSTDNSGSPQRNRSLNPSPQQPQTLSSGHVPAISDLTQRLKNQHPNIPDHEISRLAMEQLKEKMATQKQFNQQRQNALNAAVGASGAPFAHQQAQQALQSSQNQATAQQQGQQSQSLPQMQNTHAHAQNSNGINWSSPAQSHAQPHSHSHHPSHNHSNSQGHNQSPQMANPSPHLQPANLSNYQQQLTQQLSTQQRNMLLQQQQQQQQRVMHSASPANVGMSGLSAGMGGMGGLGSPAQMHAGMGSPAPMAAGMLRPPSSGGEMGMGSRSATPMQRPGTAGAE